MYKFPLYEVDPISDIRDMVNKSCAKYADRSAFKTKRNGKYESVTYGAFCEDYNALGTALLARGLGGKKIAVIGENRYEWAVSYTAVVCGLGVVVPFDKELPGEELLTLMEIAEVDAVIVSPKYREKVTGEAEKLGDKKPAIFDMEADLPGLMEKGREMLRAGDTSYKKLPIDPNVMSILLFTSGTTGVAKGVMLSHAQVCDNLYHMSSMCKIYPTDVFLSVLPLHHTYECTCGFLCAIYSGSAVAYCEGLRHLANNLVESGATMLLGVPLLFENIHATIWKKAEKSKSAGKLRFAIKLNNALRKVGIDLSRKLFKEIYAGIGPDLRLLVSGAAAIDPKVIKGMQDFGLLMIQGYGLTECAPIAALNRDYYFDNASAGLPLPGVEIKIDNPDENGNGEILIKGPNLMMGYYQNAEATNEAIKDGWFYSGDVGHIDKRGFVFITGRKKNVIITKNGKNVFPEELETYLNRCPYISESLVSGKFDAKSGDVLISAQIIPDEDAVAAALGENPGEDAVLALLSAEIDKINDTVQNFKRIAEFKIRKEAFKKTTTQKIRRHLENQGG